MARPKSGKARTQITICIEPELKAKLQSAARRKSSETDSDITWIDLWRQLGWEFVEADAAQRA